MDPDLKNALGAIGIGATVIGIGIIAFGSLMAYRNYLQTELLKLQIVDLTNRIQNPEKYNTPTQVIPTN